MTCTLCRSCNIMRYHINIICSCCLDCQLRMTHLASPFMYCMPNMPNMHVSMMMNHACKGELWVGLTVSFCDGPEHVNHRNNTSKCKYALYHTLSLNKTNFRIPCHKSASSCTLYIQYTVQPDCGSTVQVVVRCDGNQRNVVYWSQMCITSSYGRV